MGAGCKRSDISSRGPGRAWLCEGGIGPEFVESGTSSNGLERDMPEVGSGNPHRPEDLRGRELPGCPKSEAGNKKSSRPTEKGNAGGPV